jgi:hypothetical protein
MGKIMRPTRACQKRAEAEQERDTSSDGRTIAKSAPVALMMICRVDDTYHTSSGAGMATGERTLITTGF